MQRRVLIVASPNRGRGKQREEMAMKRFCWSVVALAALLVPDVNLRQNHGGTVASSLERTLDHLRCIYAAFLQFLLMPDCI
jgi:hypothetical protein